MAVQLKDIVGIFKSNMRTCMRLTLVHTCSWTCANSAYEQLRRAVTLIGNYLSLGEDLSWPAVSSEAHCCVTANLVHASASPTYSTAHTTYKSVLLVSLAHISEEMSIPLTTQILKESSHQVQRCGLFHSYIPKLSHAAVLQTRCFSQCHSLSVCLWRCHPNRKREEDEKDRLSFFFP